MELKLLISTQSTVEYDGHSYYGNSVRALWKRYYAFGDQCRVIVHSKNVKRPLEDRLDDDTKLFVVKKINSFKAIVSRYSSYNAKIAEEQVRWADLCIVHLPSRNGYQVIRYCKKYGKPYLTVVCGCPWDALWNHGWKGKLMAPLEFFKLKRYQRTSPYSIYVTNEFLQNRYPSNGLTIGCSNVNIPTGVEGVLEKRIENVRKRIREGRVLKIGTAAAVNVAYKGQEYVIRALAVLKKKGIVFEYHLIGKGDNQRLLSIAQDAGVADQVFFYGSLPHEKVLDYLDDIDIYVQPSKQEGLPRSLIEAMSRGCLCLGSKTAGIPELIEKEYVFSKGNVGEIQEILCGINEEALLHQGQRNFEKAKEYDCRLLNERRNEFVKRFIKESGF